MKRTIEIKYSCNQCGIKDKSVQVIARDNEDISSWMNSVGYALSRDHDNTSPYCKITKLDEVKIPILNEEKLGGVK